MNNEQIPSSYSLDCLKDLLDKIQYKIVMHNDDWTPVLYVMQILDYVFEYPNKKIEDKIMEIQENGRAVIMSCSMKKAYQMIQIVEKQNKIYGYPLHVTVEM